MLILFLDESGDHSLDKIDPQYPIFVLGGCIISLDYHEKTLTPKLKEYKKSLFGRDDFILHTADIYRQKEIFVKLKDKEFRSLFYSATNKFVDSLDFKVLACGIKKDDHLKKYGLGALDPYMLSIKILLERFVFEIKRAGGTPGYIVAESRDETLNNQLRLAWMDFRTSGTEFISASEVRKYITDLHIREKKKNISGLQLADLIVSPVGRFLLGKNAKQDWKVIEKKFCKNPVNNKYKGYGLVKLPK